MCDSPTQHITPASRPLPASRTPNVLAEDEDEVRSPEELRAPPFHVLPSLPNFRDIGGWPILSNDNSSKHFRTNLVFRGPDTTHISPADIAALQNLGITKDYDLRSAGQIAKLGFRDLSEYGIKRVWLPVFSDEDAKTEGKGVKRRYEQYASDDVAVRFLPFRTKHVRSENVIGHRLGIHLNTHIWGARARYDSARSTSYISTFTSVHALHNWK